jgi:hypothetical protein
MGADVHVWRETGHYKLMEGSAAGFCNYVPSANGTYHGLHSYDELTDQSRVQYYYYKGAPATASHPQAFGGGAVSESIAEATISVSGTTGSATPSASFSGSAGTTGGATPTASFSGAAGTTGSAGEGKAFNILPPYETKYMWERTE